MERSGNVGWHRQRTSFGVAAGAYERGRPGYPREVFDWLLPPAARRVLDLGAGTGKLTRSLVERGLDVVAVEPSDGMRAEFARVLPGVPVLAGSGEVIPLDAGSVDAVLAGQAWHWVDVEKASAEVARVLADGGRLGLVWNHREPSRPWVAELERLIAEPGMGNRPGTGEPTVAAPFGPLERHDVPWEDDLDRFAVLDLVASRSYVITLPDDRREALLTGVRNLLETHPDLAGRARVSVPYVARCYRTTLPACSRTTPEV